MTAVDVPLTLQTALTSWRWDLPSILLPCAAFAAYALLWRRTPTPVARLALFGAGSAMWVVAGSSFVGVYSDVLFWVRALQFVLLLMVAPLLLALGTPVAVLRDASPGYLRAAGARVFASRRVRVLAHPITTSAGLLVTPWLTYLTPWYPALLAHHGAMR